MSRSLILVLAFLALVLSASAHANHARSNRPVGWRQTRAIQSSTCTSMSCAVAGGNCGMVGTSVTFCPAGQFCSGTTCTAQKALGAACNPNAQENECSRGSCVNNQCQIFQEVMPGNACSAPSECWYSEAVDGSGSGASDCINNVCKGKMNGETCVASHQCFVGSFCSAGTCKALGVVGETCQSDSECGSRFTCLSSKCSARYTQAQGQTCTATEQCKDGLYCKSGACAPAKTSAASKASCDINGMSCQADEECACQGFQATGQTATCSNIQGTFTGTPAMENDAYTCMTKFGCGSNMDNSTTVKCITDHCTKEYCTYFSRASNDLFTEFPSCLVSRMVASQDYFSLFKACDAYKPTNTPTLTTGTPSSTTGNVENSATSVSISFALAALVAFALLF